MGRLWLSAFLSGMPTLEVRDELGLQFELHPADPTPEIEFLQKYKN